jgi:hypothetical protein
VAGKVSHTYPPAEQLLEQVEASSVSAVARELSIPRPTLQAHVAKLRTPGFAEPEGLSQEPGPDFEEVPVVFRDYSKQDEHYVYPLGDAHKGSPNHELERWREWLAYLERTPEASLLGTGDFLNAALTTSVSDVYEETDTVSNAKWELIEELRPLAESDRLDVLLPGNHELRITKAVGECPIYDTTRVLDVPYARAAALVVYRVGEIEYELFVWHGSGSGRSGAQANRMERQSQIISADIFVSGHTHRQQVVIGDVFHREDNRVVRRKQVYLSSGSFLSYEPYASRTGLPPAHIGAPRIRLDGTKKDAHVSL